MNWSLSPGNCAASSLLMFLGINSFPKNISIQFGQIDSNDVNRVDGGNGKQATISILSISLKIKPKHGRNLGDGSDRKVKFTDDIMSHFDSKCWEETFLYSADD